MGEVVNLNRVRKRVAREQAKKEADANRIKFGRSKTERTIDETTTRRQDSLLEQHRIDREDET
ncbi:DUF4169 family protein [Bradyrhizobium prioriisuperbiae]|uniref:DUF4169 family protein n=1 Tax=Bradyrhizobium prioriisuperbiae TaxID=2854389 RepID=UPI0028E90FA6|nr:DUF4169 family protein [Bradyrhizobium prioritasuperba]